MSLEQTKKRQAVTASRSNGDSGRRHGSSGAGAHGGVAGEDFSSSFSQLQDAVRRACALHTEWEARVVAGIRAMIDFAIDNPAKVEAVTVNARRGAAGARGSEQEVIAYFAGLLGEVTPDERRFPISSDEGIVESIATIVRGHLLVGTVDQLPGAAPDLIYLALMPYAGLAGTRRWIDSFALIEE
jgi:hypothetical protein